MCTSQQEGLLLFPASDPLFYPLGEFEVQRQNSANPASQLPVRFGQKKHERAGGWGSQDWFLLSAASVGFRSVGGSQDSPLSYTSSPPPTTPTQWWFLLVGATEFRFQFYFVLSVHPAPHPETAGHTSQHFLFRGCVSPSSNAEILRPENFPEAFTSMGLYLYILSFSSYNLLTLFSQL